MAIERFSRESGRYVKALCLTPSSKPAPMGEVSLYAREAVGPCRFQGLHSWGMIEALAVSPISIRSSLMYPTER